MCFYYVLLLLCAFRNLTVQNDESNASGNIAQYAFEYAYIVKTKYMWIHGITWYYMCI